jgi:L-ascorbate metabolism protein UlaG (beta-lactamase superfamily)
LAARILIDPVFSAAAAPVPYANNAFDGTNPYTAEDVPEIDYLLITHDHWDHLDYSTVTALRAKTKAVVVGLGVGAHFELWGYDKEKIEGILLKPGSGLELVKRFFPMSYEKWFKSRIVVKETNIKTSYDGEKTWMNYHSLRFFVRDARGI